MELHCRGNPYAKGTALKSIISSALFPEASRKDTLTYPEKGQAPYKLFVEERYLSKSTKLMWDPMTKLKLYIFSNWMGKTQMKVGKKVIKLREQCQLVLGRCLVIQKSRSELVQRL